MATQGNKLTNEDLKKVYANCIMWIEYTAENQPTIGTEARVISKDDEILRVHIPGSFYPMEILIAESVEKEDDSDKRTYVSNWRKEVGLCELFHVKSFLDSQDRKNRVDVSRILAKLCVDVPLAMAEKEICLFEFFSKYFSEILTNAPEDREKWLDIHFAAEAFSKSENKYKDLRMTEGKLNMEQFLSDKLFLYSRDGFSISLDDVKTTLSKFCTKGVLD